MDMYDIMNVGHEYIMAEKCRKDGDVENAIKHYQSAIDMARCNIPEYINMPTTNIRSLQIHHMKSWSWEKPFLSQV